MILSNKVARTVAFFYAIIVHVLILILLFKLASAVDCSRDMSSEWAQKYVVFSVYVHIHVLYTHMRSDTHRHTHTHTHTHSVCTNQLGVSASSHLVSGANRTITLPLLSQPIPVVPPTIPDLGTIHCCHCAQWCLISSTLT